MLSIFLKLYPRAATICALLILTGCAGVVSPGVFAILMLVFFLSAFSAGCRALLPPEEPSETALRMIVTGGSTGGSGAACSNTVDYTKSFSLASYDPATDGTGVRIDDAVGGHNTGYSLQSAGDFNGDGLTDVLVSAYSYNGGEGRAYVIFGSTSASTINLSILNNSEGIFIRGENTPSVSMLGAHPHSVAGVGDVNGDGFDDILVGGYSARASGEGSAWLIYGTPGATNIDLNSLGSSQGVRFDGSLTGGGVGAGVSGPGDVNGDGVADLLIMEPGGGPTPGEGRGYVVYGNPSGWSGPVTLSALSSAEGFTITGETNTDVMQHTGRAGDLNGDGLNDMLVGSINHNSSYGAGWVIYGQSGTRTNVDLATLSATDGYKISGRTATASASWGLALSGLGDFDGDGLDDLAIGSPIDGGTFEGMSAVLRGGTGTLALNSLAASDGFFLTGAANEFAGSDVRGGGDLNNDGLQDLIVGGATGGGGNGAIHVVFGQSGLSSANIATRTDGVNGFRMDGNGGYNFGIASAFLQDFNGDHCNDLIVSQPTGNISGNAYIIYGGTAQ